MKTTISIFILILSTTLMSQNTIQPSVDVSGEGIVTVVPDEVTINLRVENTRNDARELKRENDRIVNDVLSFLKQQKIDEKYIKTQYIRLSKNYDYNSKSYNFSANQAISVKLTTARSIIARVLRLVGPALRPARRIRNRCPAGAAHPSCRQTRYGRAAPDDRARSAYPRPSSET